MVPRRIGHRSHIVNHGHAAIEVAVKQEIEWVEYQVGRLALGTREKARRGPASLEKERGPRDGTQQPAAGELVAALLPRAHGSYRFGIEARKESRAAYAETAAAQLPGQGPADLVDRRAIDEDRGQLTVDRGRLRRH